MKLELGKNIIRKRDKLIVNVRGWDAKTVWGVHEGIALDPMPLDDFQLDVHALVNELHLLYLASGMSITEFSRAAGFYSETVNRWFNGRTDPAIKRLGAAFCALGYEIKEVKI